MLLQLFLKLNTFSSCKCLLATYFFFFIYFAQLWIILPLVTSNCRIRPTNVKSGTGKHFSSHIEDAAYSSEVQSFGGSCLEITLVN